MAFYCAKEIGSTTPDIPDDVNPDWPDPGDNPPPGYSSPPGYGILYNTQSSATIPLPTLRDTMNAIEVRDMYDEVVDPEATQLNASATDWDDPDYQYEGGDYSTSINRNGATATISHQKVYDDMTDYSQTGDDANTADGGGGGEFGEAQRTATPGDEITDGGLLTLRENYDDGASIDDEVYWAGVSCRMNVAWAEGSALPVNLSTNLYARWKPENDPNAVAEWYLVHGRVDVITALDNQEFNVYVKAYFLIPDDWDGRTIQFMWLFDLNGPDIGASPNTGIVQFRNPADNELIVTDGKDRLARHGYYIDDPESISTSLSITLNPKRLDVSLFYSTFLPDTWEDVLSVTAIADVSTTGAIQTYDFNLIALKSAAGTGPLYLWVVMKEDLDDSVVDSSLRDFCDDLTLIVDGTTIDIDAQITEDGKILLALTGGELVTVFTHSS